MTRRDAAVEQVKQLRAAKLGSQEIRQKLIESGLSKAQAEDLVPLADSEKPPIVPRGTLDHEDSVAILQSTINYLDSIGSRVSKYADRYPDLGTIRNECLGVSRRLHKLLEAK